MTGGASGLESDLPFVVVVVVGGGGSGGVVVDCEVRSALLAPASMV